MCTYECRYILHEIQVNSKAVKNVTFSYNVGLKMSTSYNGHQTLNVTVCSPNKSYTVLSIFLLFTHRSLKGGSYEICPVSCGCNDVKPRTAI